MRRLFFSIVPAIIFLLTPSVGFAKDIHMTWRLRDALSGTPIVGAIVVCEHENYARTRLIIKEEIVTDEQGEFFLEFESFYVGHLINLIVSAQGYKDTVYVDTITRYRLFPKYLYLPVFVAEREIVKGLLEPKEKGQILYIEGTVRDLNTQKPLPGVKIEYDLKVHGSKVASQKDTTNFSGGFAWMFDSKYSEGLLTLGAHKRDYSKVRYKRTLGNGGELEIYLTPEKGKLLPWSLPKSSFFGAAVFGSVFTTFNEARDPGWSKTDTSLLSVTLLAWVGFFLWP